MLAKPHNLARVLNAPKPKGPKIPAGFAKLPIGCHFRCPDCEYVDNGVCQFKDDPDVYGKRVTAANCCNHFDNPKMEKLAGWSA